MLQNAHPSQYQTQTLDPMDSVVRLHKRSSRTGNPAPIYLAHKRTLVQQGPGPGRVAVQGVTYLPPTLSSQTQAGYDSSNFSVIPLQNFTAV